MTRKNFEKLVSEAVNALPDEFLSRLDNVEIVVEDFPSIEVQQAEGLESPWDLLGYYEGVPLTERDGGGPGWLPDRITVYQKPLESVCGSRVEMFEEIQRTIVHEVAHYFGIDDDRITELGWE